MINLLVVLPDDLAADIDEARFKLRVKSRQELIRRALHQWLVSNNLRSTEKNTDNMDPALDKIIKGLGRIGREGEGKD